MSDPQRQRTVAWQDPGPTAALAGRISGMELFQKIMAGELPPPPIVELLGLTLDSFEKGRVVFSLEPGEYHYNPIGAVHGGVIATLLDSAVGCAVHTTLPVGVAYTTLELKVNFIRGTTIASGRVSAEGKTVHVGRSSAVAEGRVTDTKGRLVATCSTTCILFPMPAL